MRRMVKFQEAVERLREESRHRDIDISDVAAQDILADLVTSTAAALGIREDTFVRSHLPNVDLADLAAHLKQADDAQKRELAEASPAVVSLENTGRLIASLAQAVRCVSLNHDQLAQGRRDKWTAVAVLDDASNCLTLLGEAVTNSHTTGRGTAVLWNDESVVYARRALTQTISNIRNGGWTFAHGPQLDADVVSRMNDDLSLLPPE
ncbi:hypothetical protein ACFFMR_26190 [Micromonospora andamanensis]|uniref:Uncharacterized protein n=1 Tax=Micromonospora andamanensis TaxID=1287068 RepID=A0ABQ4HS37_9ACTN|nr:hypothetical protein [Micromonospora andamanensis]GIJ08462.1 hypothetical protein Van01_16760 [Micromonospora andamanensis]